MRTTPRVAGFRSEYLAGFELECMAGFVGIRIVELLLSGHLTDRQLFDAPKILLGLDEVGLSLRQLSLRTIQRNLVRTGINAEKDLVFLHPGTFRILALKQNAAHLRADLNVADTGNATSIDQGKLDGLWCDGDHPHLGRWRWPRRCRRRCRAHSMPSVSRRGYAYGD